MAAFPPDEDLFSDDRAWPHPFLGSTCLPRPGWVMWDRVRATAPPGESWRGPKWQCAIADGQLRFRGSVSTVSLHMAEVPSDVDGDGRWEVVLNYGRISGKAPNARAFGEWVVLRLGADTNEVVWAGVVDLSRWASPSIQVAPRRQDGVGGRAKDLALITFVNTPLPDGRADFHPSQTVAVFGWERPGGVLVPRSLPKDGGMLSWSPPDGKPVKVATDADLEPVLARLLPIPDDFGLAPVTQPTTLPGK
jgi:hypothetical protein